ncbi:hypothetical protein [Sphingobium sp.]|uniref:hypothetical protein n=1 Tax=Sphingobium sp. TaxID=1912891 RepID=UPI000DB5D7B3|nr:hypothetical protein [Sphingobium sp.]PZU65204.1 MAG: hypothetical protein DI540_17690 [Sphingobium sp.]
MTDIIQEFRGLLAEERKALRDMKESGAPNDALLGAWLKASGRLNQASTAALPALLDRLEAAERVANAARDYASNYLLDEREDPTLCFEAIQHERIIELFDALDAPAIREVKP